MPWVLSGVHIWTEFLLNRLKFPTLNSVFKDLTKWGYRETDAQRPPPHQLKTALSTERSFIELSYSLTVSVDGPRLGQTSEAKI